MVHVYIILLNNNDNYFENKYFNKKDLKDKVDFASIS